MIKEAYAKTRTAKLHNSQTLILKREHVIAHNIYTTQAKIGGKIREIEIEGELGLSFSVDGKCVLQIKRLNWKFRGNERIEVAGVPVEVYWDVYNWVFDLEKENRGNAVFMFRFEEGDEQRNRQQIGRSWFTFGHALFGLLFFGHIWHGARTLFRDVFVEIDPDLDAQIEFGAFQKLGDNWSVLFRYQCRRSDHPPDPVHQSWNGLPVKTEIKSELGWIFSFKL